MARIQLKNKDIIDLKKDIENISAASPAFKYLLATKISAFYAANSFKIKLINDQLGKIVSAHAMHDENNKPILAKKEDGKEHYTFVDAATEEKFIEEMNEYLAISNFIEI